MNKILSIIFALGLAITSGANAQEDANKGNVIKVRDLYNKDASFSPLALEMEGKRVSVFGFMAPPLKAELAFFVLTKMPMAVCPFCETEAEWPTDIIAIYGDEPFTITAFNIPLIVTGTLSLGTYTDPELGFVSRVRLMDADVRRK